MEAAGKVASPGSESLIPPGLASFRARLLGSADGLGWALYFLRWVELVWKIGARVGARFFYVERHQYLRFCAPIFALGRTVGPDLKMDPNLDRH